MANLRINLNVKNRDQISNKWTYNDISTPFTNDFKGNKDVAAVRGSIANILNWRKGQRILYPQFGNDLESFIYENVNDIMIKNIKKSVTSMLSDEPRINVINIIVTPQDNSLGIRINVEYSIPTLGLVITDVIIIDK